MLTRWRRRRSRCCQSVDDDAFALAAGIPEPAIYGRYPIISTENVLNHYMQLEVFRPVSPPPLKGPTESVCSPAAGATLSVGAKARFALRDRGIPGLLRDIRDYVRWLVASW